MAEPFDKNFIFFSIFCAMKNTLLSLLICEQNFALVVLV